jgi:predicted TIM-barrel fold metal-dependent hydrolase
MALRSDSVRTGSAADADRRYLVVSADAHVAPILKTDLRAHCESGMLEAFDDFVAQLERQKEQSYLDGGTGMSQIQVFLPQERWEATRALPGLRDPDARHRDMDDEGVVADVLFHGAQSVERKPFDKCGDLDLEAKGKRIYNRWLAEFVSSAPERHVGVADLPMWDVDQALADVTVARRMGLTAANLPAPRRSLPDYNLPIWEPFWSACEDLGIPLVCHAGVGDSPHYEGREAVALFLAEVQWYGRRAFQYLTLGGVFERHPQLKLVVAESDAGWLPHYMYRMDHAARINAEDGILKGLSKLPSEYIRDNVYATFQDDETAYHTLHQFPVEHLLWASDFPHTDSTWPRSRQLIAEQAGHLDEAQSQAIFRDNTARLFNLPAGDASWRMEAAAA